MPHHHSKFFYLFVGLAIVATLGLFSYAYLWLNTREIPQTTLGATYSWTYAQSLGLDPIQTYQAVVDELGVKHVRLPVYWSSVEYADDTYDWSTIDELMAISEEADMDVTVVVGMKVPRWPECYIPDWAESLEVDDQHRLVLAFIEETVNRYKDSSAIVRWQVDNEPFFPYGECPIITGAMFKERVDLVRSLDTRPIQVTVSGELGPWLEAAQAADVLGISMYRQTWNDLFGYFVYPLTPEFYYFRAQLVEEYVNRVVISELQAEPWFPEPIESRPMKDWYNVFPVEHLQENVEFAQSVGVSEAYLWGVEWWYAMKTAGDDRLWNAARTIFETR